jgi:hypothetical protein
MESTTTDRTRREPRCAGRDLARDDNGVPFVDVS